MTKKIVLAGGTGFIGQYLQQRFEENGDEVVIISRRAPHVSWDDSEAVREALEGADMLVNLAGKSVNCRYNEQNKKAILQSRIDTTNKLGEAVLACERPPKLWLNSSTATIYRHAEDRPMTEANGELGSGFSENVAKAWEEAFFSFQLPDTRQAALRISIVLGGDGGALTPYRYLTKFGLGGKQGSGKQMVSWIHVEDVFRVIRFIEEQEALEGVINCTSPQPVSNKVLTTAIRRAMNMKIGLPATAWMLEIGTFLLRTESELILKSRWVLPERLLQAGFTFQYETIDDALSEILVQFKSASHL
ncbi:TIGR01777 family oxidoreductase [Halalkalibacterium halodurans]|uniref:TIGR01777 family oxidoreductase n=1 Tax=Halalkalibacterium halodurans TaxID=86665 RepID=UPI002AA99229|nr:TIGR01777 family oxidoreductase [Halalkalibacterium halodurans]MDY7224392.1 TIGR01777 family oxidoreductase [Halalkalibacterium halodurans]MDY7243677.1 TIGR01777 family oxidoreductase [Halalkalibacterium halodurans]